MCDQSLSNIDGQLPQATEPADNKAAIAKQRRRVRLFCLLSLIAAGAAALLAWIEVESILATLPAVVLLGLVVVLLAMRRTSWLLLCYGLAGFWSVAIVSLVIAGFDLSPERAVPTVPILLTIYAVLLTGLLVAVNCAIATQQDFCLATRKRLQFRVSTLMLLVTVVCVLSALGKLVTWRGEMWIFASGGLALLGVSALFAIHFARRLRHQKIEPLHSCEVHPST